MNFELIDYFKRNISYFSNSSRSYFDSSSFTLVNDLVLDAFSDYYKAGGGRPTTGLYPGTSLASVTIENCRSALKNFFSVKDGEIVFPLNRSVGLLQILYSLSHDQSATFFVYTGLDHDTWLPVFQFAKQNSYPLVPLPVATSLGELDSIIQSSFKDNPVGSNILILPFTSLGNGLTVTPSFLRNLRSIPNTFIILDCSFAVGLSNIQFSELPIDAAVFDSNIGLGGPIGSGILYIAETIIQQIKPYVILGNGTITKVQTSNYSLDEIPQRLETAINPSVLAGLTKSLEILQEISLPTIEAKVNTLTKHFFKLLEKNKDFFLVGPSEQQSYNNIIGFVVPPTNMHEIAMFLDEVHEIDIRSGSFCAHQLIDQLYSKFNLENSNLGILQLSFHYYNDLEDLERLFTGIREFLNIFK